MCDEILAEIKNCPELLTTNISRYDGGLQLKLGAFHADPELHILLFDIIYCSHVYNLFDGITFERPKPKEIGLSVVIANGIISLDTDEFKEKKDQYLPLLKKADSIPRTLEYAARALETYEKYLEH